MSEQTADPLESYVPFQDYDQGVSADPPLPADDTLKDVAAPQELATQPEARTEGTKEVAPEAKAEGENVEAKPEGGDDALGVDDTPPAKVEAQPEGTEAKGEKEKSASFFTRYLHSDTPAEDIRAHLQERSPARYGQLEQAIIDKRLDDPVKFATDLFGKSPDAYGKFARTAYTFDPAYFLKQATGRDVKPEELNTALDFYTQNKDRNFDGQSSPLTKELFDEITDLFSDEPEKAEAIKAWQAAQAGSDSKETEQLRTQLAELQGKVPKELTPEEKQAETKRQEEETKAQETIKREQDETGIAAMSVVHDYVEAKVDDRIGKAATKAEYKSTPEVATARDFKREVFFNGFGDYLPSYTDGFLAWGKGREEFERHRKDMVYFSDQREKENAASAARNALPLVDKYFDERLKHPVFKYLDRLIDLAAKNSNPESPNETFIPGAPSAGSQTVTPDAQTAFSNLAYTEAMKA